VAVPLGGFMNLENSIREAWSDARRPDANSLTPHSCPECDEIAQTFAEKDWRQMRDIELLRYNGVALTLFSASAFHYYLPAFMIATLNDPKGVDLIPDTILSNAEREVNGDPKGWLPLFTEAQRRTLAAFLLECIARGILDEQFDSEVPVVAELLQA
jgi:hypothetical protein